MFPNVNIFSGKIMAISGNVIGKVAVLQGQAFIQRPDGTRVELKIGDPIHEGDVIVTRTKWSR